MKKAVIKAGKALAVFLFWLGVWLLAYWIINNELLFPSPKSIAIALWKLLGESEFWLSAALSMLRIVWGILVAWILGSALAVLTSFSKVAHALLTPLLSAIKATPVACFIVLVLVLMKDSSKLPVLITALIVIPIVWANVSEGIGSVDSNLREVATLYRFSPFKRVFRLYLPSIAPYFFAACRSSLGMAWKAGIATEVLALPKHSIGREIYFAKNDFDHPTIFAWTLVVIALSLLIEKLVVLGLDRLAKKLRLTKKGESNADT